VGQDDVPVADKNVLDALLGAPDLDEDGQRTDPAGSSGSAHEKKGDDPR